MKDGAREPGRRRDVRESMVLARHIQLTFDMILESSVLYRSGVATRQNVLLTSAQACQSLLSSNWDNMGGKTSNGRS